MFLKQGKEQWRKGDWWVPAPKVRAHGLPACPYCKQHLGCFVLKLYSQFLPSTGDPLQWSSAFWSCKKGLFFIFSPEISDPHPKSAMDHFKYELWAQESLGLICIYSTLFGSSPYWQQISPSNSLKWFVYSVFIIWIFLTVQFLSFKSEF